ncbi:MAG: ComF family protein [Burkholderiales bacterium]
MSISTALQQVLQRAKIALPQDCLLCAARADAQPLCADCERALPYHDAPACPQCAHASTEGRVCGECLAHPPSFDMTLAAFDYRFPVDALVHQIKYRSNLALVDFFAGGLLRKLRDFEKPDTVFAMPLHSSRLQERGFNQSVEIARSVIKVWKVPLQLNGYRRTKDTKEQAQLPWKERHANVRGAFTCDMDLRGQHVGVVDDVMTTGATLNEFATTLKKSGAEKVSAYVVARTLRRER